MADEFRLAFVLLHRKSGLPLQEHAQKHRIMLRDGPPHDPWFIPRDAREFAVYVDEEGHPHVGYRLDCGDVIQALIRSDWMIQLRIPGDCQG